jgi:hypothetical protein
MEVSFTRRPTADRQRGARPDPKNEPREPTAGRHQDPWWVAQARHRNRPITVSIYMVLRSDRPLQTWKTFLSNHMEGIASIDLFVVPTTAFQRLFTFLVLDHERRRFAVTRNLTADWLVRQITEAFPWDGAPKYLICDNGVQSSCTSDGGSGTDPRHSAPLGKTDMLNA